MRFSAQKIEEVKQSSDIVEIVGDYVQLRKRGTGFTGLCPFHKEKTPSFNVNPNLGIYKCFGCGRGGDVVSFVMEMEGGTFIEAIRRLAERTNVALPDEDESDAVSRSETESVYAALRFAGRYFYEQMTGTESGREKAWTYFLDRGFTEETIRHFGLGFAPEGWDNLLQHAASAGIKVEYLERAGLVLSGKNQGYYDRFRGRATFPIFSHVGKVIGFGARLLGNEPGQPKYINSPETEVYRKSEVLYGLFQARQAIRRAEEAILVEGYTDVISLHQAGIKNTVASSGTALTAEQLRLLRRYAKKVLIVYDGDSAGSEATVRGIDLAFENGITPYVLSLPDQSDPDTFVKQFGAASFNSLAQRKRVDFVRFRIENAVKTNGWDAPEDRAALVHSLLKTIAVIPDPILQDAYLREVAEQLRVPEADIRKAFAASANKGKSSRARRPSSMAVPPGDRTKSVSAGNTRARVIETSPSERILIRLMLERKSEMVRFILGHMSEAEFTVGPAREVVHELVRMHHEGKIDPDAFLEGKFGPDVRNMVAGLLFEKYEPSERWGDKTKIGTIKWDEKPKEVALSAMAQVKLQHVHQAIEEQRKKLYVASENPTVAGPLLEEMKALLELKRRIERREFIDWDIV